MLFFSLKACTQLFGWQIRLHSISILDYIRNRIDGHISVIIANNSSAVISQFIILNDINRTVFVFLDNELVCIFRIIIWYFIQTQIILQIVNLIQFRINPLDSVSIVSNRIGFCFDCCDIVFFVSIVVTDIFRFFAFYQFEQRGQFFFVGCFFNIVSRRP